MKILLEDTIPFGRDYLDDLGEVTTYAWQTLTPDMLCDVDILALRSTTKVTPKLLERANKLQFVTTATAGTNHLDKGHLDTRKIPHASAAGCNAVAVAEYVLSVLLHAHRDGKLALPECTVGIVGAGNVGSALSTILSALDITHLLCDPPLEASGDRRDFVSLERISQCDVISLHVPFVKEGPHATGRLIDGDFLNSLHAKQLLINACRGEVIDEAALTQRLGEGEAPTVVLDVFDNEPNVNTALFKNVWFVTPHIAGHSVEGKVRGTQMIYEQISEVVGKPPEKQLSDFLSPVEPINVRLHSPRASRLAMEDAVSIFHQVYDIAIDDKHTRETLLASSEGVNSNSADVGKGFANMRKHYRTRRECSAYTLRLSQQISAQIQQTLEQLGFTLEIAGE